MKRPSGAWRFLAPALAAIWLVTALASSGLASDLDQVLASASDRVQVAQASQQRIDQVVDQTAELETEYKQIMKQIDGLGVYNDYIQRQISSQEQELATLQQSLDQVGIVERQIMPLMIRMLDGLEQFIGLDKPFLMDERRNRVIVISAIDNLMKGASGQAVQNMNIIYSLDETEGLSTPPIQY